MNRKICQSDEIKIDTEMRGHPDKEFEATTYWTLTEADTTYCRSTPPVYTNLSCYNWDSSPSEEAWSSDENIYEVRKIVFGW